MSNKYAKKVKKPSFTLLDVRIYQMNIKALSSATIE